MDQLGVRVSHTPLSCFWSLPGAKCRASSVAGCCQLLPFLRLQAINWVGPNMMAHVWTEPLPLHLAWELACARRRCGSLVRPPLLRAYPLKLLSRWSCKLRPPGCPSLEFQGCPLQGSPEPRLSEDVNREKCHQRDLSTRVRLVGHCCLLSSRKVGASIQEERMLARGNLEKESLDQPGVADGMAEWGPCRICFTNKQILC